MTRGKTKRQRHTTWERKPNFVPNLQNFCLNSMAAILRWLKDKKKVRDSTKGSRFVCEGDFINIIGERSEPLLGESDRKLVMPHMPIFGCMYMLVSICHTLIYQIVHGRFDGLKDMVVLERKTRTPKRNAGSGNGRH